MIKKFKIELIVGEDGVGDIRREQENMTVPEIIATLEIEKMRWINVSLKGDNKFDDEA